MPLLSTHAPHAHGLGLAGALATRVEAYNQPALAAGHVVYRGGYELHRPVRVGGQNHSNSPHRHLQATSADLGRFFVGGGVFWGRAFGPNGPIRRAGPIGGIPRVLITDGPSRYGSIDTSLLYPRLGVPSFFTHSTQMIDLAQGCDRDARSLARRDARCRLTRLRRPPIINIQLRRGLCGQ